MSFIILTRGKGNYFFNILSIYLPCYVFLFCDAEEKFLSISDVLRPLCAMFYVNAR